MSKASELREHDDQHLESLLAETQNNLFRLRLQSETERLEAPSEIIKAKRQIARIKTVLRLRQIDRERAAAAEAEAELAAAEAAPSAEPAEKAEAQA